MNNRDGRLDHRLRAIRAAVAFLDVRCPAWVAPVKETSRMSDDYLPVDAAAELFARKGLPLTILWGLARAQQTRDAAGDQAATSRYATERGIQLRTQRKPGSSNRLLYHAKDLQDAIRLIRDAMDTGRSPDAAIEFRGDRWLPSSLVEKLHGFPRGTIIYWNASRPGTHDCPWLGRKLQAHLWLTRRPDGIFRWVWFYKEAEILAAKSAREQGKPAAAAARPSPSRDRGPKLETPDPDDWADSAEAKKITGARATPHLYRWTRRGFPAPLGVRLPLKRKVVSGRAYWRRRDLVAIAQHRAKQWAAGGELTPVLHHGVLYHRERQVVKELGCTAEALNKWATRCPSLGGEPFHRVKIPSLRSTKPDEWGYQDDQFRRLMAIPAPDRTWGRSRTDVKPWFRKAPRVRGKLAQLSLDFSKPGKAPARQAPKRKRGGQETPVEDKSLCATTLTAWEKFDAEGGTQKQFVMQDGSFSGNVVDRVKELRRRLMNAKRSKNRA